ncbi:NlpC/P60 family protein, partial [Sphingobium sp. LSP13-1-1.1]|uniref:NlpC/P60 family protein n=1 Tax=Sphingobium sp. LSP13-1-1.1 TaxID=3135234 RepID=UPI00341C901D
MALPFLPDELWQQMVPVFGKAWPCEAVVAIWPDEWRQLDNVAAEPMKGFTLSDEDRLEVLTRKPLALLHSHPNGFKEPSDKDTLTQLAMGVPWGVVPIDANPVTGHIYAIHYPECWGAGLPIPALLGRQFLWGVRDCMTLAQDFYTLNGVHMPRIPRYRKPHEYPKGHIGNDPFRSEPKRLGLKDIQRHERRPGDLSIWINNKGRYDHCAVYLGDGRFLTQSIDQASEIYVTDYEEKFIERKSIEFLRPKSMKKDICCDIAQL